MTCVSPPSMKRSSLIAIVNRLYLNANNEQTEEVTSDVDGGVDPGLENGLDFGGFNDEVFGQVASMVEQNLQEDGKCQNSGSKSPQASKSPLSLEYQTTLTTDTFNNGLAAVGGCRRCAKTFTDRLSLIHHVIDHFPSMFYSFEPLNYPQKLSLTPTSTAEMFKSGLPVMFYPLAAALSSQQQQQQQFATTSQASPIDRKHSNNNPQKNSKSAPKPPKPAADPVKNSSNNRFTDFSKPKNDLPYDMCPHCCQTFADHEVFEEHVKTHDTPVISSGTADTGCSPVKCEYCDLRFSNEYLLKEHKRIHCRVCSVCSKILMTAFDLNLHMGLHSGFNYDCKDCGRCFPDRKTLAVHNKLHRTQLSSRDSEEDANKELLTNEGHKKIKLEKSGDEKPESFFNSNPYFENIFKESPRKRRHRPSRMVEDKFNSSPSKPKKLRAAI